MFASRPGKTRRYNDEIFHANPTLQLLAMDWSPKGRVELGPAAADLLVIVSGGELVGQQERRLKMGMNGPPSKGRGKTTPTAHI